MGIEIIMTRKKRNNENSICAVGDFKELFRIRDFVYTKAIKYGFEDEEAQKICLAVDEACSNLIRYAFRFDSSKEICIQVEFADNYFTVDIMDEGAPFDPLTVNTPDMNEYFRKFRKGGLGIQIMRKVMDEIYYSPSTSSNPRNILKLKKALQ